jgi:hypothetical protein
LNGLVRAQFGVDQATEGRYTYVAAALMLPALGGALGIWVGRQPAWRHAALLPLLVVALLANGYGLLSGKVPFQERANFTRAYVEVVTSHADAPAVLASEGIFPYPAPPALLRLTADHGSPLTDRWMPSVVRTTTPELRDQALSGIVAASVSVEQPSEAPTSGNLEVVTAHHVVWTSSGTACVEAEASGAAPSVTVRLEATDDLSVQAGASGVLSVALGLEASPQTPIATADVEAGTTHLVRLPDMEPGSSWSVRLDLPAYRGLTSVCSADPAG